MEKLIGTLMDTLPDVFVIGLSRGGSLNFERLNYVVGQGFFELLKKSMFYAHHFDEEFTIPKNFQEEALKFIGSESQLPLQVFIVTDFETARSRAMKQFMESIRMVAAAQGGDVNVYHIILDMLREFERFGHGYWGRNMGDEREAFGMGTLPCLCNLDNYSYTVGYGRLKELAMRIAGLDLPLDKIHFPNYNEGMLRRIALHINREDFNPQKPRLGAIPKYGFNEMCLPVIPEDAILAFDRNIERLTRDNPPLIKVVVTSFHFECPHCHQPACDSPESDVWDKETMTLRCGACGGHIDAKNISVINQT